VHLSDAVHAHEHLGMHCAQEWDDRPQGGPGGQNSWPAGQPPIFTDGAPASLVMSLVTSNTLSKSLDATRVQETTFVGDSLSGRIALVATVVDTTFKDSIEVRRKILGFGGEVKMMGMN
jgi:hypothetical protein